MKRLLFGALVLTALMFSCKGKQTGDTAEDVPQDTTDTTVVQDTVGIDTLEQLITETPMPRAADELFDDFLFNFAANRKLQMERVAFPLAVIRNGQVTQVGKDSWQMERFFMRQDFYTVLFDDEKQMELVKDTSVSRAIVEKIYFNTGAVQVPPRQRGVDAVRGANGAYSVEPQRIVPAVLPPFCDRQRIPVGELRRDGEVHST